MLVAFRRWFRWRRPFWRGYVAGLEEGFALVDEAEEEAFVVGFKRGYVLACGEVRPYIGILPPGDIARRSYRHGKVEALDDTADTLDELAVGLGDTVERVGGEVIEGSLRLAAGYVRAEAEQLRAASRAPAVAPLMPRDEPDGSEPRPTSRGV